MSKTWSPHGVGLLMAGILGIVCSLLLFASTPMASMYALLVLVVSILFIVIALATRKEVHKESEKPMMEMSTQSDEEQ